MFAEQRQQRIVEQARLAGRVDVAEPVAGLRVTAETVRRDLTIVTNSLPIALTLSVRPGLTVLMVGGRVRGRTQAAVDDWAARALGETYVDVAFVGASGISVEHGLTTPDPAEAAVKRAMLAAARRVVVLADHTKVGATHFARFGDLAEVAMLITDSGLDADVAARLEAAGPTVVRA